MDHSEGVVLLIELATGEVVAVPFESRDKADWWKVRTTYKTIGCPRVITARGLAVGAAIRAREATTERTP